MTGRGHPGETEADTMSTPVTTSFNAWRPVSLTERVAVRERGRVCAHEGCATILSIYNPLKYCSAHATEAMNRRRRGGPLPVRATACEHCGAPFRTKNAHRRFCSDRCRMAAFARRKRAAERDRRRLEQREAAANQGARFARDAA
jgi:endogenous inhibitor of DNA gyrase (YacG/DUF329 family)